MNAGINDTYAVRVDGQRFALRLYGREKYWIGDESELRFELELLNHLHSKGVPTSHPLPRRAGELLGRLATQGEQRSFALFTWAEGQLTDTDAISPTRAEAVGRTIAQVHVASDSFQAAHHRYSLDERFLLDRPLRRLEPRLVDLPRDQVRFIREQAEQIRERLRSFTPSRPDVWGVIHADVHGGNYHFTDDDQITLFDFDLCAYGWRAYDFAYYYTRVPEAVRSAVLDGYQQVRTLDDAELEMLATFGRAAWIWEELKVPDLIQRLHDPYI